MTKFSINYVDERNLFNNGAIFIDCRDKKTVIGLKQSIYTKLNLFVELNNNCDDIIMKALEELNIVMFFENIDGIIEED